MSSTIQDKKKRSPDWIDTLFQTYEAGLNGKRNYPLFQYRNNGYRKLQTLSFPTRKDEDWKYTSLNRILELDYQSGKPVSLSLQDIDKYLIPDLEVVKLVFVNGVLDKTLSQIQEFPEDVQIYSTNEALEIEELKKWIESQTSLEGGTTKNTFLSLNQALAEQGILLKIKKNSHFQLPIHLIYISTPESLPHIANPQVYVWAQDQSESTLIESYHSTHPDSTYLNNTTTRIALGNNAELHHYRLQQESLEAFQINNVLVTQKQNSRYSSYGIDLGGRIVRNNLSTRLLGSGTETNYYGIYLGKGNQHIDNQTYIDHAVPHCQSNELYKGILNDRSRGVFNGKVMVRQDAQKTNAFQQNNSLVLSPAAVMNAKPQLEIYADDVKCSHGATIGQLDEAAVFYLRCRGISKDQARKLLQIAFIDDVLAKIPVPSLRSKVQELVKEKLAWTLI